ncbi:hypothetical protein D9M71_609480 [compost metagenome]
MCSKNITKVVKKLDPLMGGDKVLDKLGLPSLMGEKNGVMATPEVATATAAGTSVPAATTSSDSVQAALEAERRRRLAASGQNSTILTGNTGVLGNANTSQKTLLGV